VNIDNMHGEKLKIQYLYLLNRYIKCNFRG